MADPQQTIADYLARYGIAGRKVDNVIDGFDLDEPVYERTLWEGEHVFQFVRTPSAGEPTPEVGDWFAIRGATMPGLAIISPGARRDLTEFEVARSFTAVEGTAKQQPTNWNWGGGGPGGMTQIFIPRELRFHLRGLGVHLGRGMA